ncbi:glycosyltransferase [Ligilactobacillus equi]|uniref:Glycosyltransferase n=1 Tax=Ligilactobacillus equi DSM 15833 = JCM 10991 TaxID=1423740 RepID=A0A0R1TLF0_9LACO|nr:glycosyltransferase [Ligilactobacillus equi]KRL79706.1 glycosyltransferase [Ligilactobacillus equi DSM 15833 = JCM 10991]
MKKILIIGLTERMGGVETFIYNTTRFSNKQKYVYDYLAHGTDKVVFQEEISKFYDNENHFYFVPSVKRNPIQALRALSKFYKEHGGEYDYVHLQTGATSELMYVLPFINKYKFKLITHSHNGNGYSPVINSIFKPLVNLTSTKKLSCSNEATDWLFGKKYEDNVEIINNGIDSEQFTFNLEKRKYIRNKYNLTESKFVVGHIGRFSEQKNHVFIIKIFKEIVKKNSNAVLMLVGTGELEESIKELVKKNNLIDKVIFCGLQKDTAAYYSAFDVFLMPSLYEGLPIVGIEAQSEGLPCYFSTSISEQIKITKNANLVSLNNSSAEWAKKITESKVALNERKGFAKVINDNGYSIRGTVRKLEEIYEVD